MQLTMCNSVWWFIVACLVSGVVCAEPDTQRQAALRYLLRQDCGSCHGMTLRGGLGPALLPERLGGRTDDQLVSTILDGRSGTPMPPWRGELSESDARYLVRVLREGNGP